MSYQVWKLLNFRALENFSASKEHLVCDIDKTYLETPFESLLKLAQVPFEGAHEKITVSGAKEFLQAYRKSHERDSSPKTLHFVSASPPSLRSVIGDKFRRDGLSWSSDTYKNQKYNLKHGRFRDLRKQVAYKTAALLNLFKECSEGSRFHMIGDNAESDPFIYLGAKLFAERRIGKLAYAEYLQSFGVGRLESFQILRHTQIPKINVSSILIRNLKSKLFPTCSPLSDPILYFDNFFEASLFYFQEDVFKIEDFPQLTKFFHNYYGLQTGELLSSLKEFYKRKNSPYVERVLNSLEEEREWNQERKTVKLLKQKDLTRFEKLSEEEILYLAKKWNLT